MSERVLARSRRLGGSRPGRARACLAHYFEGRRLLRRAARTAITMQVSTRAKQAYTTGLTYAGTRSVVVPSLHRHLCVSGNHVQLVAGDAKGLSAQYSR
ncbi:hypothetical protein ACQP25_20330 [Microtetraspora malaysiensis]|uniref:hypothetical protein n=1 Tax=Microtetraspora malaysiensis TaxID=161358 RepID=UPI003D8EC7E8